MSKENKKLDSKLATAYRKIASPWMENNLIPPPISTLELSRVAKVPIETLVKKLGSGGVLISANGDVEKQISLDSNDLQGDSLVEKSKSIAPFKRAIQLAEYRSRAPGGGPVIKRRILEDSLEKKLRDLGQKKLPVVLTERSLKKTKEETKEEIYDRLSVRWLFKSEASTKKANVPTPEQQIDYLPTKVKTYKSIVDKYDLFSSEGGMTRSFRISPDTFNLNPSLFRQIEDMQDGFYGTNGVFKRLDIDPPAIMRLDLGITNTNELKIFEVEGDKTNGFGYSACADLVRGPDSSLPGIPKVLSLLVAGRKLGIPIGQRFYKPEMYALAKILRDDYQVDAKCFESGELRQNRFDILLNWPQSWGRKPNSANLLIPQSDLLDDKGFLAELYASLSPIKRYLPETLICTKENISSWGETILLNPERIVLKLRRSSGASGVALDRDKVISLFDDVSKNYGKYVVQRKVDQQLFPFSYLDPEENTLKSEEMYTRIEAYLSKLGIASVLVTARAYLPVHGATDSIQISASVKI